MKKKVPAGASFVDQSVWVQADQLLARSLLDSDSLCSRVVRLQRRTSGPLKRSLMTIEGDALLVRQSLAEAAALRGLSLFGKPGETCAYNPLRHDLGKAYALGSGKSTQVKIKAPGVVGSRNRVEHVLIRAKAALIKKPARPKTVVAGRQRSG